MASACENCEAPLNNTDKFCAQCGQSVASYQRPFIPFLINSLHELFDVDGRLGLTLKTLVTRPGKLSYDFSQGKRVKYTPALRLYLAISVIFFLLFAAIQGSEGDALNIPASNFDLYPKAMFVLFPFFALLASAFFRASYFLHNLVFSMHIHSIAYVILALIGPLERLEQNHLVFTLLQIPAGVYFLWYFLVAFKTMYQQSWGHTVIKSFAIYFVYMAALGLVFDQLL